MNLESWRYVVLAGYRRRSLLPAPCDAYLIQVYENRIIRGMLSSYMEILNGFHIYELVFKKNCNDTSLKTCFTGLFLIVSSYRLQTFELSLVHPKMWPPPGVDPSPSHTLEHSSAVELRPALQKQVSQGLSLQVPHHS